PSRAQAVDGGGIDEGRAPAPDPAPPGPVELEDVSEAQPDYVIGISYPRSDGLPPALAAAMKDYAESARADLMEAVESRRAVSEGGDGPMTMYDLSLTYSEVLVSPEVVAYAADGSTYTGGAHGVPLVARFVWLPREGRMLTAERLVPVPQDWERIAGYVRERLREALPRRMDTSGLEREGRWQLLRAGGRKPPGGGGRRAARAGGRRGWGAGGLALGHPAPPGRAVLGGRAVGRGAGPGVAAGGRPRAPDAVRGRARRRRSRGAGCRGRHRLKRVRARLVRVRKRPPGWLRAASSAGGVELSPWLGRRSRRPPAHPVRDGPAAG